MEEYGRIWELPDIEPKKGFRWCWWFWLVFIDNPVDPDRPRQVMILWSFKDAPTIIHDTHYHPGDGVARTLEKDTFPGVVAAWYFDGEEMDHDLALEQGPVTVERELDNPGTGRLFIDTPTDNDYVFEGSPRDWRLRIRNEKHDMDYTIRLEKPNVFTSPLYRTKHFLRGLFMYSVVKLNRCTMEGTVDGEKVTGTAYLQRIGMNNPCLPWFWGVLHFADGSILKYFFPHVSTAIFRSDPAQRMPGHERLWFPAKREMEFYHAPTDTLHTFKRGTVERHDRENGMPEFDITFRSPTKNLTVTIDSYAHTHWRFRGKRPLLPINDLYYNEYPVRATHLSFTHGGREVTLADTGPGAGNAEHTWGGLF